VKIENAAFHQVQAEPQVSACGAEMIEREGSLMYNYSPRESSAVVFKKKKNPFGFFFFHPPPPPPPPPKKLKQAFA